MIYIKRFLIVCFIVLLVVCCSFPAFAYGSDAPNTTIVSGAPFFDVSTSQLGNIVIFLPINYMRDTFCFTGTQNIFNLTAGTVTGFATVGNDVYTVRWLNFSTPQYRVKDGSGYQYDDLTITAVNNTNIDIVDSFDDLQTVDMTMTLVIIAGLLGVVILCLFWKKF